MNARYTPTGTWLNKPLDFQTWYGTEGRYLKYVTIEVSDVIENRSGHVWRAGAHRVWVAYPYPKNGRPKGAPRSKTFIGETAWCDAERYAADAVAFLRRYEEGR